MLKTACLIVAAAILASAAPPALAARHHFSCYDHAWESQELKDCLAHPEKARHLKMHKHKGMKHDMKSMKAMPMQKS